jgi:peptidoglycan-associated lipoprotein
MSSAVANATPAAASPQLGVSNDLAKQCQLKFANRQEAPKFDYDQFQLLPEDRDLLEQVAQCLTQGPLKGRKVELIGRADPRGTEEYNLGLGTRRASTVGDYLRRLGVSSNQLSLTTRGDLDATGRDDSGWHQDRRVDLQLRPI